MLIGSVTIITPGFLDRIEKRLEREYNLDDEMGRLYIWNSSFKLIKENPILGVGNGNFAVEYAKNLPPDVEARKKHVHAHNDLLNFAAIFGLPGMILYLLIWLELFHILWEAWKKSSVEDLNKSFILASFVGAVVFFVTSFTEATFIDEEVRQMLMFIWAIGLGSVYNDYEK
jgi:O-antigen ligase